MNLIERTKDRRVAHTVQFERTLARMAPEMRVRGKCVYAAADGAGFDYWRANTDGQPIGYVMQIDVDLKPDSGPEVYEEAVAKLLLML